MPIRCRNRFLWPQGHAAPRRYAVLDGISPDYPPATGRSHTRYSPVRRSPAARIAPRPDAPRLACVRPVASVHPEPGSNSPLLVCLFVFFLLLSRDRVVRQAPGRIMCCYRIDRAVMLMTLLLYYFLSIVIISMFLFACPSGKSVAKLQPLFHSRKLFGEKIC